MYNMVLHVCMIYMYMTDGVLLRESLTELLLYYIYTIYIFTRPIGRRAIYSFVYSLLIRVVKPREPPSCTNWEV